MDNRMTRRIGGALCAGLLLLAAQAEAQPRRGAHEQPRYSTPHWVYDARYHHNHYYPAIGYQVSVLPPGNIAVHFRGGSFWFHSGVWYQHVGPRYVVVRPPIGIVVPVLPPAYSVVYYGGVPYYYADDAYYVQEPTGYEVVAPPPDQAPSTPAPGGGAAPAPASGTWYYCESAKGYYPYVGQCPEGWKSVPATPPPGAPR
ncbi:MAG TPA: DUF6515 family protein [Burkholderiales bacterium]|jgi:hypothetical protein|nr:DUF6515 family protein [Burkholderiales bacterium]